MRLLFILFLLPFLVFSISDEHTFGEDVFKAFNASFGNISVPGAILFDASDSHVNFSVYGYYELDSWNRVNSSTDFVLGSLSELVIAHQILHYVDDKKLSLSDSVRTYIPSIKHDFNISALLSHRAGVEFSRVDSYTKNYTLNSLDKLISKVPTSFIESQDGVYTPNPTNYLLLAKIIEHFENTSFESYLNSKGFKVQGPQNKLYYGSKDVPYFSMIELDFTSKVWPSSRIVTSATLWQDFLTTIIFNKNAGNFTALSNSTFALISEIQNSPVPPHALFFEDWHFYTGQFLGHINAADDLTPTDSFLLKLNGSWISLLTNFVDTMAGKMNYQQDSLLNVFLQHYLIETTDFPLNLTQPFNGSSTETPEKRASAITGKWYPSRYERGFLAALNPTIYIANQKELVFLAQDSSRFPLSGMMQLADNLFMQRNVSSESSPRWQLYGDKDLVMMNGVVTLIHSSPINEFVLSSVFFSAAPFIYIISVITICCKGQTRELEEGVPDTLMRSNKSYFAAQFILLFLSLLLSASVYYLISYAQTTIGGIPKAYFECPETILKTAAVFSYLSAALAAILVIVTFGRVYALKRHVSSCLNCWLTIFAIFIMIYTAWGAINGTWDATCIKL